MLLHNFRTRGTGVGREFVRPLLGALCTLSRLVAFRVDAVVVQKWGEFRNRVGEGVGGKQRAGEVKFGRWSKLLGGLGVVLRGVHSLGGMEVFYVGRGVVLCVYSGLQALEERERGIAHNNAWWDAPICSTLTRSRLRSETLLVSH